MDDATAIGILAATSFLPALAFVVWVRAHERHQREPVGAVLGIFAFGGTLGIGIALLLGALLDVRGGSLFVAAVVVAPFVEELAKGLGFGFVRRHVDELEDGLVYGASVGVGFAATETFLYALMHFGESDSAAAAVGVIALRTVSSLLLHAGSSALLGLGYAAARLNGASLVAVLPSYLLAVLVHAVYNFLVLRTSWLGFLAAIAIAGALATVLRRRIRHLDAVPAAA